jgi:hypothetical protein
VKRATIVLSGLTAGCLAFTVGCGSSNVPPSQTNEAVKDFGKMGQVMAASPETKISRMQTPQEKTAYLQELAKDPDFKPQLHTVMLDKCSKDPDPELSALAKDLLNKAK